MRYELCFNLWMSPRQLGRTRSRQDCSRKQQTLLHHPYAASLSLSSRSIPLEWKLANVVRGKKKGGGEREYTESYRPISLLSIISKVLERCVLDSIKSRLYSLVDEYCQHGFITAKFITAKSCVTNLIESLEHIGSTLTKSILQVLTD